MALTMEQERAWERLRGDTVFWAKHCAHVLTERKQVVPLIARPWQASFDAALERQREAGMPMRALILKARKLGFSTWVQAKFTQRLTQFPHEYALAVAQDRKTSGVLANMVELMYERLPTEEQLGLGFSIRPGLINQGTSPSGARFLMFGDHRRRTEASMYETMTAGAKAVGRGFTPSMFHGSEVAWWDNPATIVGMLNAIPDEPETIAVLESTANGFNHFHGRWVRAMEGAEDPDTGGLYVPLFYGWQDNPANSTPFVDEEARRRFQDTVGDEDGGGDPEEILLLEEFGVSLEQLRWRRNTISEKCEGKIELFHQEHPATPEQAFIGSGEGVFAGILIAKAIADAGREPEPVLGVLRPGEVQTKVTRSGTIEVPRTTLWVPKEAVLEEDRDRWGSWQMRVWEHPVNEESERLAPEPRPDGQYVVFADVAQGTAQSQDSDLSAIQVIDHISKMQVAVWHGRIDIHDFPLLVLMVGVHYNYALIAPEVTGLGIGVLDALAKNYGYPYLYRRRRSGDDRRKDQREQLLGWNTDGRTKPLMEQTFGEALKDGTHGMRDLQTARQFTTYVENEKGQHGAQSGTHDDLVMSWMGARRVAMELMPRPVGKKAPRPFTPRDEVTGW